jgi:4-amino-4-deoxy-L-arabinose transferase-like glycosyltransferase
VRIAAARRAAPPESPPRAESLPALVRLAGPAAILVTAIAMLAWTWRTWPDPLVDFGREAYHAWQVTRGKTLYVDLAHFSGPLSVYANALFFRMFGPGILTLALTNAVLTAGCIAMLYCILVRVAGRLAATLGGLAFVTIFAFGRFVRLGNCNWLCPYSYELTHGLMLSVAGLWFLDRYQRTRRLGWLTAMGAALGLVALTKTEALFAAAIALPVGLALTVVLERPTTTRFVRIAASFAAGALLPLLVTFAFFASRMPVSEVLRWPLGYWRAASRPEFAALPMYREGFGTNDLAGNLRRLAQATGWYAIVLAAGVAAAFVLRGVRRGAELAVLGIVSMVVAAQFVPIEGWLNAGRPLPLFLLLITIGSIVAYLRSRNDPDAAPRYALQTSLALFALALLPKMVLNARVFHYGFALAMPATLVLIAALVSWGPALLTRAGLQGRALLAVAAGVLVAGLVAHLVFMQRVLARQTRVLGEGADLLYGDNRAAPLADLLAEIRRRVGPTQTLAAVPEGAMLNYLARLDSSVPYVQFSPVCMLLWGEREIERDFEAKPPDFLALVHRDNRHEGARFFGRDYAQSIMGWIESNYHPVWRTGAPPLRDDRFGLVLLERNRLARSTR